MPRRLLLLMLAAAAAGLSLVPDGAQARTSVRVGIGDQQASMFDHPAFQRAKFRRVRYFIAWNAMDDAPARLAARAFVQRARRDGFSSPATTCGSGRPGSRRWSSTSRRSGGS
jgi:hypothetical protein